MSETEPGKGCILVAGTQPGKLETLCTLLTRHGYAVLQVNGSSSVLKAARESRPDLIFLDAALPDGDSYETCELLKANPDTRDIPVILVLAQPDHGSRLDRSRAFAAGAADYVTAPFQEQEILARVQTQLALAAMRNQLAERDAQRERALAERAEVEQALREAEEAGLDLLENLRDVIYTADRDGILTYVSPAIESFLGYTPSEVEGRHIREFIHPKDLERLDENFASVLSGHYAANEYCVLTKSGELRWMRTSSQSAYARPLGARGGQMIGVQGVLADITESKRAEEQIRQQNEFLTSVLESLTHPFYVLDAHDYTVQIANSAARLGTEVGQATCYALTHGKDTPCGSDSHPCTLEEIKRTRKPVKVEHIHYDAEGNARNVEIHGYPLLDDDGYVARVIEYTLDITERKQAEDALREREETWRSLTEYSPDYIMLLDREAKILFVNHTLPELSREQVIGTSFHDYALEEYRQATQECFDHVLRTGQPDRFESVYVDENGIRVAFESYVGPVMRDGKVWGLTVRSTNITERKRAEEALKKLSHDLGERVKELNCLFGISALVETPGITLAQILQGTVDLVPAAWQYPDITCARIVLDGQEFHTESFREAPWQESRDILVHGRRAGRVQVCYLEEKQANDEGPFLKEEQSLINAIAQRLGRIVERMRAEAALNLSEERYALAQRAANIGSWDWDIRTGGLHWSDQIEPMFGFARGEFGATYESFLQSVHPEDRQYVIDSVEACIHRNADYAIQHRIVWPDGTARWVSETGDAIRDENGKAIRMLGVVQDITERKEAEKALRQSEKQYRQLLDALQEGIWVIDQDAYTTLVNPRMAEMLGYAVEEMQGKHLFSFMDERGIEITQRNLKRREQGIAEQHDFEFLRKDGSRMFALLETSPIYDDDGNYVGGIAGIQDITDRRQAEEALQKSEALLAETQRMASVGGWELNLDTSEVIWTEEVYRIHEVPTDFEPALENALAFYDPEDRPILEQAIQRAGETGEPWDLELRFITAKGNRLWVRAIGKAERQDGRVVRLSGTFQDITERKQAEQALRESEARWRSVTQTSPDHVMLLDRDLVIEFVNYASPGLTVEELIGTLLYAYVSEERQSEIKQILESVLDTTEPCSYETEFSTPDGNTIYYESRVVPRIVGDQVVGLAVNARDITAHKQAEQALQTAKEAAEQARLEEWERRQEADRRRRMAESLADVLAALNSNQPLDQVLDFIALQARHLLDNHAVAIYRLQDTAGILALQAAKGLPSGCIAGTDTPPGLEALRQAVGARQPVLIPDVADSLPDDAPLALDTEGSVTEAGGSVFCQALLAVPIVVQDEVYGGMLLYYAEPRTFSGDELELAAVFGDQVALAIENARLREQVKQAAATAERSRLARDLHDSVTQALFSASLVAEVLPQVWQRDPEEARQGLEELRHLTRGALAEMRTLLLELRPTALLETRLDDLLRQLTEAITSRAQISATLHIEPNPLLPPDVHVTFYRVTQEALHNTVKHAGANRVTVSLQASPPPAPDRDSEWQGQIELRVTDDGQGFDPGHRDPNRLGLGIMHERAASVGARLAIESQPGQGTQVILVWQNTPKGEGEHHDGNSPNPRPPRGRPRDAAPGTEVFSERL
jgi:PAS domain S-box-containing protein